MITTTFNDNTKANPVRFSTIKHISTPLNHAEENGWIKKVCADRRIYPHYKQFMELIGSMDETCKTMNFQQIKEGLLKNYTLSHHDGKPFDSHDVARFQQLDNTLNTDELKGTSNNGIGLRLEMGCMNSFDIGEDIRYLMEPSALSNNLDKVSFIVSKITQNIIIKNKETGIDKLYTPEDKYLVLSTVTNQSNTWLKYDCPIDDVETNMYCEIMNHIKQHPQSNCFMFYHNLYEKNSNYKDLCDHITTNFKLRGDDRTSGISLMNKLRFITSSPNHINIVFNIEGYDICEERDRKVIDPKNGYAYHKIGLEAFTKNKKNYVKWSLIDHANMERNEHGNTGFLYLAGREKRKEVYNINGLGIDKLCKIEFKDFKTDDIPDNYKIPKSDIVGKWTFETDNKIKWCKVDVMDNSGEIKQKKIDDPRFIPLREQYGNTIQTDSLAIQKNGSTLNCEFSRSSSPEDKIDAWNDFSLENRGCRGLNTNDYMYEDGQHMNCFITEHFANKTILNINSEKCNSRILKSKDNDGIGSLIQFLIPCFWREFLAKRKERIKRKKNLTTAEINELQKVALEKENEELKKQQKDANRRANKFLKEKEKAEEKVVKAENKIKETKEKVEKMKEVVVKKDAIVKQTKKQLEKTEDKLTNVEKEKKKMALVVEEAKEEVEQTKKENEKLKDEVFEIVEENKKMKAEVALNSNISDEIPGEITKTAVYTLVDNRVGDEFKIGMSGVSKEKLLKQYPKRYHPKGVTIKNWVEIKTYKKYELLAEKLLHNRYSKFVIEGSEWFDVPEGKTREEMLAEAHKWMESLPELLVPLQ